MRFRYAIGGLLSALAIVAGVAACSIIPDPSPELGPNVLGKLKGSNDRTNIPFSPYTTGSPVIATEAFATPGVPKVLGAGGSNATYQDGDYLILNGAGTFALASAATTKTNGVPNGAKFILQNYKSGIVNPITYGSSCYAVTGNCPTSISYGDTWLYTVDQTGGIYRATKLGTADEAWTRANFLPLAGGSITATANGSKLQVAKYATGSGHSDGPKWNTLEMQYLLIGGLEYGANTIRGIGFGYSASNFFAPAFIGYQEASTSGSTNGDLFFATRPTTTAVVPTERLRITAAGDLKTPTGYVPATATSLAPKNYVDGRSLTPNAIAAIKLLTPSSTLAEVIAAIQKQ